MVENMCKICALGNPPKQSISDTFSTRESAARDMLLELLSYGTLYGPSGVLGGNNSGQKGKEVAIAQRCLTEMFCRRMNCTYPDGGRARS